MLAAAGADTVSTTMYNARIDTTRGLDGEAVAPLQQSVSREPNNATYQYHLGTAFAALGKVAEAERALQRALSLKLPADQTAKAQKALADLK